MKNPRRKAAIAAVSVLALLAVLLWTEPGRRAQFLVGGALVNLGHRMQDHLASYDSARTHELTPTEIWDELMHQNRLSASVRERFPRTARHPLVAMVVCMDARLDTAELTGDTRKYYYVVRTAGSAIETKEAEMLELAVENGVRVIVLTTHTDCAAEGAAASPTGRQRFPALTRAIAERGLRLRELVARPFLAERIADGRLLVEHIEIDTATETMQVR
jgi:hypothetical protein